MKNLKAHPAAEAWPMIDTEELQALADDIEANGLRQPIVLDGDGLILDGRNRYEACKLAKVQPTFETFDGDDPVGFVLSCNLHRRHMTKGQRAIATARTCKFSLQSVRSVADASKLSHQYIHQANQVLEHVPDLADAVAAGSWSLNDAYTEAKRIKAEVAAGTDKLTKIKAVSPDIAEQVEAGSLTVSEAWAAHRQREQDEIDSAKRYAKNIGDALAGWHYLRSWYKGDTQPLVDEYLDDTDRKNLAAIKKEIQAL